MLLIKSLMKHFIEHLIIIEEFKMRGRGRGGREIYTRAGPQFHTQKRNPIVVDEQIYVQ